MIETVAVSAIVIISVMLFGSVSDLSFAVVGIITILFFNIWVYKSIKKDKNLLPSDKLLLRAFTIFAFYALFQIIPLPDVMLRIVSPEKYSLTSTLSLSGFHSVSLYPYASMHAILKFVLYAMIFLLSYSLAVDKTYRIVLIKVIVFFGLFLALFALIQKATWNGKIYWIKELTMGGSPFGPFVNRNHYAGFIGMIVPFGLALGIRSRDSGKRMLYVIFSVIMSFSLFYSLSRGGIISFILSMILFSTLIMMRRNARKLIIVPAIFAITFLSYIFYFGINPIIERFTSPDVTFRLRVEAWEGFLEALQDFWLAGAGLGTFKFISPLYHPEGISEYFDHAHNDYLEFFIEMGIIGLVLMIGIATMYFRSIFNSKWWHNRDLYFIIAGFSSFTSIVLHSLVDFNLHIPSNAIMLSVILGLVYGIAKKRG